MSKPSAAKLAKALQRVRAEEARTERELQEWLEVCDETESESGTQLSDRHTVAHSIHKP